MKDLSILDKKANCIKTLHKKLKKSLRTLKKKPNKDLKIKKDFLVG